MTQQELLGIVAEKIQASVEKTTDVLDVILRILSEELIENGIVDIDDFGIFRAQKRSEYISLNSKTGERLLMPPAIVIVFEPYFNDNTSKGVINAEALCFEPDITLRNSLNSAFINFEPTVLNEGVELPSIEVISDAGELSQTSALLEDYISNASHSTTEESDIALQENEKIHLTPSSDPPIKKRSRNSRIWMPILGGVAITLAALFFFNGTSQENCK